MGEQAGLRTRLAASATGLPKVYGSGETEVRALDGVPVEFPAGGFTAIMGPSGSGKSTLLHCMAGLDHPTSGSISIGETELTALKEADLTRLRRGRLGCIFQAFNLIPTLTALENIELPVRLAGAKPDREWIDALVDTVGLRDRLGHRPAELSAGNSSAPLPRVPWRPVPRSCSATSRPAISTPAPGRTCWSCCGARRRSSGRPS